MPRFCNSVEPKIWGSPFTHMQAGSTEHASAAFLRICYQALLVLVTFTYIENSSYLTTAAAQIASPKGRKKMGATPAQAEGLKVSDVVVLIDRQQGGAARMASNGLRLHSAFTLTFILDVLVRRLLCSAVTMPKKSINNRGDIG